MHLLLRQRLLVVAMLACSILSGCGDDSAAEADREWQEWIEQQRLEDRADEEEMAREEEEWQELSMLRDQAYDDYSSWNDRSHAPTDSGMTACQDPRYQQCIENVVEVVNADTLRLENGELVRLAGIDAPETYLEKECYGEEAAQELRDLITGPEPVEDGPMAHIIDSRDPRLIPVQLRRPYGHPNRDVHGRLLRIVEVIGYFPDAEPLSRKIGYEDPAKWLMWQGMAHFDDYALRNYATTAEERERMEGGGDGFDGYRESERRDRGGWVACGWR